MIGDYVLYDLLAQHTWLLQVSAPEEPTREEWVVSVRNLYPGDGVLMMQRERIGALRLNDMGDLVPKHQTGSTKSRRRTGLLSAFTNALHDDTGEIRVRKTS